MGLKELAKEDREEWKRRHDKSNRINERLRLNQELTQSLSSRTLHVSQMTGIPYKIVCACVQDNGEFGTEYERLRDDLRFEDDTLTHKQKVYLRVRHAVNLRMMYHVLWDQPAFETLYETYDQLRRLWDESQR